jgi:NADH dehydrogenase
MQQKSHTIAILGGSGFVGRHLCERLHRDGHRLRVLTRNRELMRETAIVPGLKTVNYDPNSAESVKQALAGCDVVINLVGVLQETGRSGKGFEQAHVALTMTVVSAMKSLGIRRLLQMSSLRAGEGDSHYLRTRGEAEQRVRESGLDWTIFRPSVIFGAGDGLFCRFAGLLPLAPVLPLARSGARFQPVWVMDVCEAIARALTRKDALGATYELGGPEIVTLADVVRYTAGLLKLGTRVLPLPDVVGALQGFVLDFLPAGLKPFSGDNFRSLKLDSVVTGNDGLKQLGIQPMPFRAVVPGYLGDGQRQGRLDRYRRYTEGV